MIKFNFNNDEIYKRIFKYLSQFIVVSISLKLIAPNTLNNMNIIIVAIISAVSFAILDLYHPAVQLKLKK